MSIESVLTLHKDIPKDQVFNLSGILFLKAAGSGDFGKGCAGEVEQYKCDVDISFRESWVICILLLRY